MDKGADISECEKYRYRLWRTWDHSKPICGIIGLNPSTADASREDPTARKFRGFAERFGYGGYVATNLFALRSTDWKALKTADDPVGPRNDATLVLEAKWRPVTICAWGTHGWLFGRDEIVLSILRNAGIQDRLHHLGLTKHGFPSHPLMLSYDRPLLQVTND